MDQVLFYVKCDEVLPIQREEPRIATTKREEQYHEVDF